jgi:hypothetical protein
MSKDIYNFLDARTDVQSIIHVINLLGPDLVGAEVGVFRAESFCTLLQNCPNIKTLHGIDSWNPYKDYLKEPYDDTPAYDLTQPEIEFVEMTAMHNIKYCGSVEKAVIHKMDSKLAVEKFEDGKLDFIFLDTYMTYEQCVVDIDGWFSKVRPGGLFAGHDWNSSVVKKAVYEFRAKNNITGHLSVFDNTWCWLKD